MPIKFYTTTAIALIITTQDIANSFFSNNKTNIPNAQYDR